MDNLHHRLKHDLKQLFNLVNLTINKLNEHQLINLLEGKGKLVYQEIKVGSKKKTKVDPKRLDQLASKILTITGRAEAQALLSKEYKVKKAELFELGKLLEVHVNKSDKKEDMIEKLIEAVIGAKLRDKAIKETNLKRSRS